MKMNRRTMLKVSGGIALGAISLPELKAETRKPLLYIIITDSWHQNYNRTGSFLHWGLHVVTRAWHVFWADCPNESCNLNNYRGYRNVKKETFYDVESLPGPVKKAVEFHQHQWHSLKVGPCSVRNYNSDSQCAAQFHCFRTYDVDAAGNVKVIYDKDGSIW